MCNSETGIMRITLAQFNLNDSDFATGVNYGGASSWSSSKSVRNHKMGITRIRRLLEIIASF